MREIPDTCAHVVIIEFKSVACNSQFSFIGIVTYSSPPNDEHENLPFELVVVTDVVIEVVGDDVLVVVTVVVFDVVSVVVADVVGVDKVQSENVPS